MIIDLKLGVDALPVSNMPFFGCFDGLKPGSNNSYFLLRRGELDFGDAYESEHRFAATNIITSERPIEPGQNFSVDELGEDSKFEEMVYRVEKLTAL
jgi:hypothetical protein